MEELLLQQDRSFEVMPKIHANYRNLMLCRGSVGMCDVRILVFTGPGLDHKEGNSGQEKRDTMEFHSCAGGP